MTFLTWQAGCAAASILAVATLAQAADADPAVPPATTTVPAPIVYPTTARGTQSDDYFGTVVADPHRWLEDDNSPQTKDWIARQNALTQDWLKRVPFRGAVLERLRTLSNCAKYSAPSTKKSLVFWANMGIVPTYTK